MESLIGKSIGNYIIQEIVGKGGMGTVFRGLDQALERTVAIKMIDPELARDESFLRRFRTEAKALARMVNPNIVTVFAFHESDLGRFIVMEFVTGTTLADVVQSTGAMPWQKALPIFDQILAAVEHAHQNNVIHRDLKPRNIMLTEQDQVKVTDFGLAKVKKTHGLESTITKGTLGTPYYMSPEQVKSSGDIDHRTDIYSLGMTFYEILAGRIPFNKADSEFTVMEAIVKKDFPSPSQFNPQLPKELTRIIMKTIEKEPAKRYQTVTELREALARIKTASAMPKQTQPQPGFLNKTWVRYVLLGVILVALLGIFVPRLFRDRGPEPRVENSTTSSAGQERKTISTDTVTPPTTAQPVIAEQPPVTPVMQPTTGLKITTEPPGASILLDAVDKGLTPQEIFDIGPGRHTLKIRLSGYREISRTIKIQPDQIETLHEILIPVGTLRLSIQPGDVVVYIDGLKVRDRVIRDLSLGRHEILVQKNGYRDYRQPFSIEQNRDTRLTITLEAGMGTLNILVKPFGDIEIDGVIQKRATDILFTATLPAGAHTLKITHPQLGVYRKTVQVKSDAPQEITVDFTKTGKIMINATPGWGNIYIDQQDLKKSTPKELELRVGLHQIQVKRTNPNFTSEMKEVLIEAGENPALTFELRPEN